MPTGPKNNTDDLLKLLTLLNIKSAQLVLKNRQSIRGMIGARKELYSDNVINQLMNQLVYGSNPFLAILPKKDNFKGKYIPVPVKVGK